MTTGEHAFIYAVVLGSPLVAAAFLWTRLALLGLLLLAASMAGALLFGVYHHYLAISPDHVVNVPPSDLQGLFRVTALLLPLTQACALGIAVWGLLRRHAAAEASS
jgi:hypothetical protein